MWLHEKETVIYSIKNTIYSFCVYKTEAEAKVSFFFIKNLNFPIKKY